MLITTSVCSACSIASRCASRVSAAVGTTVSSAPALARAAASSGRLSRRSRRGPRRSTDGAQLAAGGQHRYARPAAAMQRPDPERSGCADLGGADACPAGSTWVPWRTSPPACLTE